MGHLTVPPPHGGSALRVGRGLLDLALGHRALAQHGPHAVELEAVEEGWDLVVSNPPYVAASEWDSLQPEIRDWEPRAALVGEGLHEEIARRAHTLRLVLEVGDDQAETVAESLESLGYSSVTITFDLTDRERVVEGSR